MIDSSTFPDRVRLQIGSIGEQVCTQFLSIDGFGGGLLWELK